MPSATIDTASAPRLTREQAAEFLGVSVQTLSNWAALKRGPKYYRVGKCVSYKRTDLETFLESCAVGGDSDPARKRSRSRK